MEAKVSKKKSKQNKKPIIIQPYEAAQCWNPKLQVPPHLSAQLSGEVQYSHSTARVCHVLPLTVSPIQVQPTTVISLSLSYLK